MTTYTQQGLDAYYSRDRDALQRLLEAADAEVQQLRTYIAGSPAVGASQTVPSPTVGPAVGASPTVPSPTVGASSAVGPSSRASHTGRSERENVLADGLGKR